MMRLVGIAAGIVFGLAAILVVFLYVSGSLTPDGTDTPRFGRTGFGPVKKSPVHLYFSDGRGEYLQAEERMIPHSESIAEFGRAIVQGLIDGPSDGLLPTIPEGTGINAFYITASGTAYADLAGAVSENHPGGVGSELFTIYSIVNTLILNIPEIKAVKILIDGKEKETLAGHIDLRFPLGADMVLVK